MNIEKEQFLNRMERIKEDLEVFKKIDFTNFDEIDVKEYSKIANTLENMLANYEKHQKDISDIFSKPTKTIPLKNQ